MASGKQDEKQEGCSAWLVCMSVLVFAHRLRVADVNQTLLLPLLRCAFAYLASIFLFRV